MRISALVVPVCFVAVTLATVVACSAAPAIPDDLSSEQPVTGNKPAKKDAGSTPAPTPSGTPTGAPTPTPTPGADGGPAPTGGACSSSATQDACFTCCETANPKALPILGQAFGDCACVAPGACKTACAATYCAGKNPTQGDACDTCLNANEATCGQQADNACLASADCKGLFACDDASGCKAKPK